MPILARVEPERVHGAYRVAQQPLLDRRGAPLEGARQEVVVQIEVAPLDAAAGEDAFGELVTAQAQPVEDLVLGEDALAVGDREPGDPRAGTRALHPSAGRSTVAVRVAVCTAVVSIAFKRWALDWCEWTLVLCYATLRITTRQQNIVRTGEPCRSCAECTPRCSATDDDRR